MNKFIITSLVLVALLFSCKTKKETKTEQITEPKEEVMPKEKINMNQIIGSYYIVFIESFAEINEIVPTINIDEAGKISGFNGCNRFFGQLKTEEQNLINNLGSTRRACLDEANDIERIMMETLKQVTNITYDEEYIKFYSDDKVLIKGVKISLERGNWQVISIEGKEHGLMPTFEVNDNRLTGNTGCNSFFGMVQQDGFKIKILEPGMTEMACPDFDSALESRFLQLLGKVTEFKKEGSFVIFSGQGKELFRAENPEQE